MFGKLFASMYDGSLRSKGPWEAIVTLQQLVILADIEGAVDMNCEAISSRTSIPLPIIEKGIQALMAPDPDSRNPGEDGRRIVLLRPNNAWGWRIVNYGFYRNLRSEEERRQHRREYHREYARTKRKDRQHPVNKSQHKSTAAKNCQRRSTELPHVEADVEVEASTAIAAEASNGQHSLGQRPWPVEGAALWTEKVSPIEPPRFGKALKPVVLQYGWPDTRAALLTYIELNAGKARKAEWFAGDAVKWVRLSKMPPIDPVTRELTEKGRMV